MKIELKKEKNPYLKREEVAFTISDFKATPSRTEIRERIAAEMGKDSKLVLVTKVDQRFGHKSAAGQAVVYDSDTEMGLIGQKYIVSRNQEKKAEGPEEGAEPVASKEEKPPSPEKGDAAVEKEEK